MLFYLLLEHAMDLLQRLDKSYRGELSIFSLARQPLPTPHRFDVLLIGLWHLVVYDGNHYNHNIVHQVYLTLLISVITVVSYLLIYYYY